MLYGISFLFSRGFLRFVLCFCSNVFLFSTGVVKVSCLDFVISGQKQLMFPGVFRPPSFVSAKEGHKAL